MTDAPRPVVIAEARPVQVRRETVDAIVAHARRDAPRECCGLLIGAGERVEESCPVENVRESEVAYLVDPAGHFSAIRRARRLGLEVIGAYHSHPRSPAVPSATDVREAHDGGWLHVIVSLAGVRPEVRGYRIRGSEVTEIALAVEP